MKERAETQNPKQPLLTPQQQEQYYLAEVKNTITFASFVYIFHFWRGDYISYLEHRSVRQFVKVYFVSLLKGQYGWITV